MAHVPFNLKIPPDLFIFYTPLFIYIFSYFLSTPLSLPPYLPHSPVSFLSSPSPPCPAGARLHSGIWGKKGSFLLFGISSFSVKSLGREFGWLYKPLSAAVPAVLCCPAIVLLPHCVVWHLVSPFHWKSLLSHLKKCPLLSWLRTGRMITHAQPSTPSQSHTHTQRRWAEVCKWQMTSTNSETWSS